MGQKQAKIEKSQQKPQSAIVEKRPPKRHRVYVHKSEEKQEIDTIKSRRTFESSLSINAK